MLWLRVVVMVLPFGFVAAATAGCADPCVTLAARICNCEATTNERRACIANRITNQQGALVVDDADRAFCEAKLEGCSCAALDTNELDSCGLANEARE